MSGGINPKTLTWPFCIVIHMELLSPARWGTLGRAGRRSRGGPFTEACAHFPALTSGKGLSNVEESVTLDNGGFAALELNSRHLNVKNTFSKKNGAR